MGSIILREVGVIRGSSLRTGERLFQDLSLTLADGDRLGLVAGNGAATPHFCAVWPGSPALR